MSDRDKSPAVVLGESVRAERMLQGKTTRELAQLAAYSNGVVGLYYEPTVG